jgi:long-chain acyl-CoA synthetase
MENLESSTLRSVLLRSAADFADRPALSAVDGPIITYASLNTSVQTVTHLLRDRGIVTGDKVALLSENRPYWGIAFFAITTMGAVAVPILPDFHTTEIHHILAHSECKAVFVSRKLYVKL